MSTTLVTGATGRIGSLAATALAERGVATRAFVRDVDKARSMLPASVDLIAGDLGDVNAVDRALDSVDRVLLVTPVHPDQRRLQGNVVRAAAAAERPLIVKIFGLGTTLDSYIDSGRWHAETEAEIADLGLPHVFLRPNFFFQNLGFSIPGCRTSGALKAAVGNARIAMVDVRDVAEVCVEVLTGEAELAGAHTLTENAAHGYTDVAGELTRLLGHEVRYVEQSMAEARASLEASGQPDWHVEILLQFNRAFREGVGNEPTDVVERVLGRPPRTLADYLAEALNESSTGVGSNPFPS